MLAIIDSGSTKADWRIIHPTGEQSEMGTSGFNPFILSTDEIYKSLKQQINPAFPLEQFEEIYFYGAGCSDAKRCDMVAEAFRRLFTNAKVVVDHDTIASAKASCGHQPGIACILGTGSNSCLYDGQKIVDHITNLGYLVGDEGSGGHLGKELLRAYFYRELPPNMKDAFDERYPMGERAILDLLYNKDKPNVFLASFAKFLSDYKGDPYVRKLIKKCLTEFVNRNLVKYEDHQRLPISFVGSVAFHYKGLLKECLEEKGMRLGIVIKKPIHNLVDYHLKGKDFVATEDNVVS